MASRTCPSYSVVVSTYLFQLTARDAWLIGVHRVQICSLSWPETCNKAQPPSIRRRAGHVGHKETRATSTAVVFLRTVISPVCLPAYLECTWSIPPPLTTCAPIARLSLLPLLSLRTSTLLTPSAPTLPVFSNSSSPPLIGTSCLRQRS